MKESYFAKINKYRRREFLKNTARTIFGFGSTLGISSTASELFSKNELSLTQTAFASTKKEFQSDVFLEEMKEWFIKAEGNFLPNARKLPAKFKGQQIYNKPLIGVGSAKDSLFYEFAKSSTIGTKIKPPTTYLENAKSVLVIFAPHTEAIRKENAENSKPNDTVWNTTYRYGERHLINFAYEIKNQLVKKGYQVVMPAWSHRHIGFICGLGTFGLAKHIITDKGGCGRMISLITSAPFEITQRTYTEIYERCIRCKACEKRCPTGAIDFSKPDHAIKNHNICRQLYTCGKCQTDVPCEHQIPQHA